MYDYSRDSQPLLARGQIKKVVSILLPRFWQQLIGWSYCATSRRFSLVAWHNSKK